jgi:hypothetical protein
MSNKTANDIIDCTRYSNGTTVNSAGYIETVPVYTLRHNYNSVTNAYEGMLAEELRTNYMYPSTPAKFLGLGPGFTVTPNYATAPDGTMTATRLQWSGFANSYAYTGSAITNTAGTAYTASIFFKPDTLPSKISLIMGRNDALTFIAAEFNTTTKTTTNYVTNGGGNTISAYSSYAEPYKDGWYRIVLTATFSIALTGQFHAAIACAQQSDQAGNISAWGLQLESGPSGPCVTSFIPTVTAQVTRDYERLTFTIRNWFSNSAGTFYMKHVPKSPFYITVPVGLERNTEGTDGKRAYIIDINGQSSWSNGSSSVACSNIVNYGNVKKQAWTYTSNSYALCLNGGAVAYQPNGTPWTNTAVKFWIGSSFTNEGYINGPIAEVKYYPRKFANSELQLITTV